MSQHEPFVDIHCHILPGLDDGASTLEESLAMAQMAVADGIGTIVATPHQLGNNSENAGAMIRAAAAKFQQVLHERRVPLRILPGADVRIEPDMVQKIRAGDVVTLADRRRHVLLELPHDVYVPLDRLLSNLAAARLVGVLSHPERNRGIQKNPEIVRPLVERGCLLQITAGSLIGKFGSQCQQLSEWFIEEGLVHFVSTDAHNTASRSPQLKRAFERVADLVGQDAATAVCCRNPAAVAAGGAVQSPGARRREKSFWPAWLPFLQKPRSTKVA